MYALSVANPMLVQIQFELHTPVPARAQGPRYRPVLETPCCCGGTGKCCQHANMALELAFAEPELGN